MALRAVLLLAPVALIAATRNADLLDESPEETESPTGTPSKALNVTVGLNLAFEDFRLNSTKFRDGVATQLQSRGVQQVLLVSACDKASTNGGASDFCIYYPRNTQLSERVAEALSTSTTTSVTLELTYNTNSVTQDSAWQDIYAARNSAQLSAFGVNQWRPATTYSPTIAASSAAYHGASLLVAVMAACVTA
eukprot:Hpha_TRINITY_DN16611_c6_g6::TRINITY_DN16611_c6_g6_i1::g.179718::m.179718